MPLHEYLQEALHNLAVRDAGIHSFLPEPERERRLLQEAEALLRRYPKPASRPPLFGVLIGVKDLFRVDGLPTRAGSRLPAEVFAGTEASMVHTLKQAGCLVLGKTVSTEFAYFSPGPTRNPINPDYSPGGSSSGSAAAVALSLCPVALGTQTIASISRPASYCGVFGFKPSFGRLPLEGVFPFAQSVDQAGYFASNLDDLAFMAQYAVDHWTPREQKPIRRILIPTGTFLAQADSACLEHFHHSIERIRSVEVVESDIFGPIQELNDRHKRLIAAEFANNHREIFREFSGLYSPASVELIELGRQVSVAELEASKAQIPELRKHIHNVMRAQEADLILSPGATSTAPLGLESTGSPLMSLPFTHAGLPTLTIPDGENPQGLPYSIQLCAAFDEDEYLLKAAKLLYHSPRRISLDM